MGLPPKPRAPYPTQFRLLHYFYRIILYFMSSALLVSFGEIIFLLHTLQNMHSYKDYNMLSLRFDL